MKAESKDRKDCSAGCESRFVECLEGSSNPRRCLESYKSCSSACGRES
ncbi:MAG: hypothetical protein WHT06_11790 [Desulfobacterales bacterium]